MSSAYEFAAWTELIDAVMVVETPAAADVGAEELGAELPPPPQAATAAVSSAAISVREPCIDFPFPFNRLPPAPAPAPSDSRASARPTPARRRPGRRPRRRPSAP